MVENLDSAINSILKDDEKILNFYFSSKTKSAYFIITRGKNEFITFRISNHPSNSFYSNRTFSNNMGINHLVNKIRKYMDKSTWYVFKYEDFFSLKSLSIIPFDRIQYYIDNTMGIFDKSLGGLVFYQSREFGKNKKEFNIVSEPFQKELGKLFACGLICAHREKN